MSDEHKRQTEYWARAAEDAGWWVQTEHRLSTGTQPDVLIHGTILTGIEVQRSAMSRVGAVKRTEKAARAGVSDVWFTDKENYPDWAFRVPTVGQQPYAWRFLPPRRAVLANGVREFIAVQCAVGNFPRCPNGRGWCGGYHPKAEPRVIPVDEVASRFPSGDIVALRIGEMSGLKGGVYLFTTKSAALYTEMTGKSAAPAFDARKEDRLRLHDAGRLACQNVQTALTTAASPRCGCCGSSFTSIRAFKAHQVIGWDNQLICPDSPARYPLPPYKRASH